MSIYDKPEKYATVSFHRPSWSIGIPFFLRKRLPIPKPKPEPDEAGGNIISGNTVYSILRRTYRYAYPQDETYTFCKWDLIHGVLSKAYRDWFPDFIDVFFDCDDYVWRAKGLVDASVFRNILRMLADVTMAAVHSDAITAKMAFFYSWVSTPEGDHMRTAGIDKEGIWQYEPQTIKRGPFAMPSEETGYLCMG